ncbi:MAG: hypothetical protein ABIZ70_06260 [Gemmatimonadales bacterium]
MCSRIFPIVLISLFSVGTLSAQGPRPKGAVELRGDSLMKAGDAKGAQAVFKQLAAADTTFLRAWNSLGMADVALNDIPAAADAFEHAAVGGRLVSAIYNAGAMHSRLGHVDLAIVWFDKAIAAGFTTTALFTTDPDLANLRKDPRFPALLKRANVAQTPCMSDLDSRRFDFWVGEWNVTPAGSPTFAAGTSVVQRVSGGCALLENWTANNGAEGKSLNAFNIATKQWQQYWVGQAGGVVEFRESHWDGPTLVYNTVGAMPAQRLSFTPIDSNTVRQFGEISTDSGKSWQVGYDFLYHRKR